MSGHWHSTIVAVTEPAAPHGPWHAVKEVASWAWLAVIGVPETLTHGRTFVRCCRDWLRRGPVQRDTYWHDASYRKDDHAR